MGKQQKGGWEKVWSERQKDEPDGLTSREIGQLWNLCIDRARDRLRSLVIEGRVVHSGWRGVRTIDGRMGRQPVYKLVK